MKTPILISQTILFLAIACPHAAFSKTEIIQRRLVQPEHIVEFIARETTYASEVALKAITDGKMEDWSLCQRMDGLNMDQSHNFIFINSFAEPTDLDRLNEVWDFKAVFPNKSLDKITTMTISTVKDVLFYDRVAFSFKARPNVIRINYAKTTNVGDYLELEQTEWFPFVQERMESGSTNVISWTLSRLIAPRGNNIGHEAISIDGFDKLSDSLYTYYENDLPFPDMDLLMSVHHKAEVHVYQLIKAVGHDSEY